MKNYATLSQYIKTTICVFCLFGFHFICAQNQISFRQLSVKDGLSQNSAISIAQDSIGYLWIATQDGLNKYDGQSFEQFPFTFEDVTRPSYSNLGKVYVDREGEIWILPIDGIPYKFNSNTNSFEPLAGVIGVSALHQSQDLTMWFGTHDKGLFILPKYAIAAKKILADVGLGTIYMISEDLNGKMIIASNRSLLRINSETRKIENIDVKTVSGSVITQNFSAVVYDNEQRQWVGTFGDGLYYKQLNDSSYRRISDLVLNDPLPLDLNILDLHIDRKNRLWIATYGSGLYMVNFQEEKVSHFDIEQYNPKAIHYNDILCIYEDYTGTLWFGTDGGGISYYDEYLEKFNAMTNYQTPENISTDVVRAITVDNQNGIWIGTSGKGLTHYEPNTNSWQSFKSDDGSLNTVPSNRIMSLLVDDDNDLWIGTQGNGLTIRNTLGNFTSYTTDTPIKLSANTIWDVFKDEHTKQTYLATRNQGLIKFDKDQGEILKFIHDPKDSKSIPANNIRVVERAADGNLWLGTEEAGIVYFNEKEQTFTTYNYQEGENSLSNNNIKSLYFDKEEILWIGTNGGGLNALDTSTNIFYNYTRENGLPNDVIYSILPDKDNNLWLSSNRGITKFTHHRSWDKEPEVTNYTNYDGLATEFNTGAYHIDNFGTMYFGGLDGFYWFKPEDLKENQILPKTTITGFDVANEPYAMIEGLSLKHDQNTLTFTFSSLQYSLPGKNQYQYKLENYDLDWVNSGNTNFARYSYLKPGSYEFQVKSSNYDGIWNEETAVFPFAIEPPWYLAKWAKLLYVLIFLGIAYSIYSYFNWKWSMQLNYRLKEDETKKLQELNTLKSKLYTDISHEFRTPLTLISGPIDSKLDEAGLTNADINNFSMIRRNTNRMLSLVDQLLDLAKVDDGKLKLKLTQGDLGLFLRSITASFEYVAQNRNIEYTTQIEPMGYVVYDDDVLEKITTNLLSNAMKYCSENGHCRFTAITKEDILFITLENTVSDLSGIQFDKIFTRFYQKDENASGAGVGLSLVNELVKLYGGEILAKPNGNDRVQFDVRLPAIQIKEDKVGDEKVIKTIGDNFKQESIIETSQTDLNNHIKNEDRPIILVVEDNTDVRNFITTELSKVYTIDEAENGKKGIEIALEQVPDIILSDVRMPICDGITLCNTLKNDERTSHIPIILLTAHIGQENELEGLKSGADDFITKPFKLRVLKTRVQNLIENRKILRKRYSQELVLKAKDIAITPTDEIFLNKLQKILDEKLSDSEFDTQKFASKIGMSRMQLHRKLLAFTGLSTTAFIRSQRLKQAIHILKTSDASINEVAYTVGFNTPSYFIKCFKETYKQTPSEYIKSAD